MTTSDRDRDGDDDGPLDVRRTVRDGDWGDPATWEGGRVPDGSEDWVTVAHRVAGRGDIRSAARSRQASLWPRG